MGLQGETQPTMNPDHLKQLKNWISATFDTPPSTPKLRVNAVKSALKCLALPKRHLRHAVAIATSVFEKNSSLLDLPDGCQVKFLRCFRSLEYLWLHSTLPKTHRRQYFLNYKFLVQKMCQKWNIKCDHFTSIKSRKLKEQQETILSQLLAEGRTKSPKSTGIRCNLDLIY
jgi:hypothetical protein